MTVDERLRERLRSHGATDKRMFGGTCFLINGNMLIGTLKDGLIVRVGKEAHAAALKRPGTKTFDMTGRPMEGFVAVASESVAGDAALQGWIDLALDFVRAFTGLFPQLADVMAKTPPQPFCCLRPVTPSGLPILGPARFRNFHYNVGHGHLGWTLAHGTASLVADLIDGSAPALDLALYRPGPAM